MNNDVEAAALEAAKFLKSGVCHGVKNDAGKPMVSLTFMSFPKAQNAIAQVGTFGAKKYTPDGWGMFLTGKGDTRTRCFAT